MMIKLKWSRYSLSNESKARCAFPTPVGATNNAVWGSIIRNIFLVHGRNKCSILNVQLGIHDEVDVCLELSSCF